MLFFTRMVKFPASFRKAGLEVGEQGGGGETDESGKK